MGRSLRQKRRSSTWSWSTQRSGWWTSTSRSWWCCPERSTSTNGWPATVSDRAALPTSTGRRQKPVSAAAQPSTFPEKLLPGRRSDAFALPRRALELFFQGGMCLSVRRAPDISALPLVIVLKPSRSPDRIQGWNSNNKAGATSVNTAVDWQLRHCVPTPNKTCSFPHAYSITSFN